MFLLGQNCGAIAVQQLPCPGATPAGALTYAGGPRLAAALAPGSGCFPRPCCPSLYTPRVPPFYPPYYPPPFAQLPYPSDGVIVSPAPLPGGTVRPTSGFFPPSITTGAPPRFTARV